MKTIHKYFNTKDQAWEFAHDLITKYHCVEVLDYYEHQKYAKNNHCIQYTIKKR